MFEILKNIQAHTLYLVAISTGTIFVLSYGIWKIKRTEKKRLKSARIMEVKEAVETDLSDEDIESLIRRQAVSNIEARFDFIKKTYVPVVLIIAAFLIFIPFLPKFSASYVSLIAGVLTVLVGLAARPLIENAISGIVITLSQPVRINDTVIIDGRYGTVEKITLLYTCVKIWNWRRYIIPNHKLLQKEFENLSQGEEQEWAHIEFYVAPGSNIEKVKNLAKESMQCKFLMSEEAPSFWVINLERDSINCWVAGWAKNPAEAWALRSTARRNLVSKFTKEGIEFQLVNNTVKFNPELTKQCL